MDNATTIEPATASPLPTSSLIGRDGPERDRPMTSPASAGITTGKDMPRMDGAPTEEPAVPDFAVQLTEEEWDEQDDLSEEYIDAIVGRDSKKVAELQRKIIFPSFILKALKKLNGADYIRKEGYNTVDADLVYGPGWLDVDDGGPEIKWRTGS